MSFIVTRWMIGSKLGELWCLLGKHDPRPDIHNARFDCCSRCGRRWRVA